MIQILEPGPSLPLVEGEGSARAVIWPGIGARLRSLHRISLGAGARTVELRHAGEAVYYVIAGEGRALDGGDGSAQELVRGSMVFVEPGTSYRLAAGERGLELVGGPCPPDPKLYEGI